MAGKADFTAEEWTQILKAPGWASIAVVAASPSGPFGVVKEMFAAGKVLAEAKMKPGANALVDALIVDLTSAEGRKQAQPREIVGKSPQEVRTLALDALKQVTALVDKKASGDADGFKRWVAGLSTKVAESAKEGGFLGIGGTAVSDAEKTALSDISSTLGIA